MVAMDLDMITFVVNRVAGGIAKNCGVFQWVEINQMRHIGDKLHRTVPYLILKSITTHY
jgi:hypothetical protein